MNETLQCLRRLKTAALDRMKSLNDHAFAAGRDLTEAEEREYRIKLEVAKSLNTEIAELESELFSAAPAVDPMEEREARRARFRESMRRIDEAMGIQPTY